MSPYFPYTTLFRSSRDASPLSASVTFRCGFRATWWRRCRRELFRPLRGWVSDRWTNPPRCPSSGTPDASHPSSYSCHLCHRSDEHTSELQSRRHLLCLPTFPTRRSSDLVETHHRFQRL